MFCNNHYQAHFYRGNKGFFAITNEGMNVNVYTGLPGGTYCNVIQGCPTDTGCAGESVVVDSNGYAQINIPASDEPILAIHAGTNGRLDIILEHILITYHTTYGHLS